MMRKIFIISEPGSSDLINGMADSSLSTLPLYSFWIMDVGVKAQ